MSNSLHEEWLEVCHERDLLRERANEAEHKFHAQRAKVQAAHLAFHETGLWHGPEEEFDPAAQIRIVARALRGVVQEAWLVLSGGDDPREQCGGCGAGGYGRLRELLREAVPDFTSGASAAPAAPSIPKFGSSGCAGGDCGKDGGGRNET